MSDLGTQPSADVAAGLSQWQRVTNTFTAPSKTFEDIKRGPKSWWLPFLIMVVLGYVFFFVVNSKIGMQTVTENQIRLDPKAEERMAQLTPEQRETQMKFSVYFTEGVFLGNPAVLLIIVSVGSLVLWGTVNFVFGGKASFGAVFAAWMFASLPSLIKTAAGGHCHLRGDGAGVVQHTKLRSHESRAPSSIRRRRTRFSIRWRRHSISSRSGAAC